MSFTIKKKITYPLFVGTILIICVIVISNIIINRLIETNASLGLSYLPSLSKVLNADRDLYQARLAQLEYLNSTSQNQKDTARETFNENNQQARTRFYDYLKLLENMAFDKQSLNGFEQAFKQWESSSKAFFTAPNYDAFLRSADSFENLRNIYDIAGELADANAEKLRKSSKSSSNQWSLILSIFSGLSVVFLVVILIRLPQVIVGPIKTIKESVLQLNNGTGDLKARIPKTADDELGDLVDQFNRLLATLHQMVQSIYQSTEEISSEIKQFHDEMHDVGRDTAKQSEAVTSLAASFHQSSQATGEIAKITSNTAEHTQSAMEVTKKGNQSTKKYTEEIETLTGEFQSTFELAEHLKRHSSSISTVMGTIRSIAEQTNLLALNAAIEAARAGEQGRGFAVVADEVRTLASRTQESTSEIDQIVSGFQTNVEKVFNALELGSETLASVSSESKHAAESFAYLKSAIEEINGLSIQTATASEEQSCVSEEINRNIQLIADKATQNSHRIERLTSIVENFNRQSNGLVDAIRNFVH